MLQSNDALRAGPQGRATPEMLVLRYGDLPTAELVAAMLREFTGRIALVSSFGADAAVLLHLVAAADRHTPVILIDSGKLFPETLAYRDRLVARLGLTDVRAAGPSLAALAAEDPDGTLWRRDPDRCCALRKVAPLAMALHGFDAWISGRKRFQGATRASLPLFERDEAGRIKLNPLAAWSPTHIAAYFAAHDLPEHPLVAFGYASIGCLPCTEPVAAEEDARAGRWRGRAKTECGIHTSLQGPPENKPAQR
jgi:phosphoadenosine phosphosulfate reductase